MIGPPPGVVDSDPEVDETDEGLAPTCRNGRLISMVFPESPCPKITKFNCSEGDSCGDAGKVPTVHHDVEERDDEGVRRHRLPEVGLKRHEPRALSEMGAAWEAARVAEAMEGGVGGDGRGVGVDSIELSCIRIQLLSAVTPGTHRGERRTLPGTRINPCLSTASHQFSERGEEGGQVGPGVPLGVPLGAPLWCAPKPAHELPSQPRAFRSPAARLKCLFGNMGFASGDAHEEEAMKLEEIHCTEH